MNRQKFGIALLALLMLPALPGCGVHSETLTAMLNAADAVRRQDFNDFEKYVDVDGLVGHVVDLTFSQIEKQSKNLGFLAGIEGLTKPVIVEQTKNQFRRLVTKGEINKLAPGLKNLPSAQLLVGVVTLFGVPQSTDNYKILDVKKSGNAEHLKMNVRLSKSEPWLPLQVQSEKVGDHYRITRIPNLDEIVTQVANLAKP
jgi:hypothetical protein